MLEEATLFEGFQAAQAAGLLWVALSPQRHPVGFALVEREGLQLHLEELDVHPQHGRRGIGGALVETVCAWARDCGYAEITLTTYRDIPWNGPFYAKLGFKVLGAAELTPALRVCEVLWCSPRMTPLTGRANTLAGRLCSGCLLQLGSYEIHCSHHGPGCFLW